MTIELQLESELAALVADRAVSEGVSVNQYLHDLVTQIFIAQRTHSPIWPSDFFKTTYGALKQDPLSRPPQDEIDLREPLL